ncbi:MAG: MFS transporter [Chloroflexi bacterium]|nr:MFS transporter [Chloroflexota bacterium]
MHWTVRGADPIIALRCYILSGRFQDFCPVLGAWLVARSGGINVEGIRPLFFVALVITAGSFAIVFAWLSSRKWTISAETGFNLIQDIGQLFREGRHLKRWLIISSIAQLPTGMILPFSQVFAHQVKGANEYVLGAMVTGSALTSVLVAVPLGRLADRVGRKKALYVTMPLFWISNLILVWAAGPVGLIVAGILQGFFYIGGPIAGAMERELVPAEQMGRWLGVVRFFRMILAAGLAFAAGLIWDRIGPQYVFLTFVAIDVFLRMPLLIGMPETMGWRLGKPASSR